MVRVDGGRVRARLGGGGGHEGGRCEARGRLRVSVDLSSPRARPLGALSEYVWVTRH